MEGTTREVFISAMHRMKKTPMWLPSALEAQVSEFMVLKRIAKNCGCNKEVFVSDIQSNMHVSKPAISQILNSLENRELIVRRIDKEDRRKISVCLTREGEETLEKTKNHMDGLVDGLIEKFGEDDAKELVRLINKLMDLLDEIKKEKTQ